jgi:hypothetical protein
MTLNGWTTLIDEAPHCGGAHYWITGTAVLRLWQVRPTDRDQCSGEWALSLLEETTKPIVNYCRNWLDGDCTGAEYISFNLCDFGFADKKTWDVTTIRLLAHSFVVVGETSYRPYLKSLKCLWVIQFWFHSRIKYREYKPGDDHDRWWAIQNIMHNFWMVSRKSLGTWRWLWRLESVVSSLVGFNDRSSTSE